MTAVPDSSTTTLKEGHCIVFSLQAMASRILASDGKDIPFTRAIMNVSNTCSEDVVDLSMHVTLGQEGGTVQDVTHALSAPPASLPPGGNLSWDVFDRLLPAHPGTASKVHMFGYRAALNWRFDLAVWATYRRPAISFSEQSFVSRWILRWYVTDTVTGAVELAIEEGKD